MDPSVEQLDADAKAAAAAAAQAEVARAAAQAEADAREKADESAVYELGKTALAALKSIQDQLLGIMDPDDENLYKYRREPWKDVRSGRVDYGRYIDDLRTIRSKTFKEGQFRTMATEDIVKLIKELNQIAHNALTSNRQNSKVKANALHMAHELTQHLYLLNIWLIYPGGICQALSLQGLIKPVRQCRHERQTR